MSGYTGQLLLVLVLVILNATFAGSEMALVSLRDSQVQRLARKSRGGKVLAKLANDPNRFLATIQIGITMAGFLASATAAVSLAQPLIEPLSFLGSGAEPAAIVSVTIMLTYVTLVLGELAPKRIAMQRAESWALVVARPLTVVSAISRPAVWFLGVSTNLVVRALGGDPKAQREEVSPEEVRDLVATGQGFSRQQREIISGAFEIAERVVREILVPRRDVVFVAETAPISEAVERLIESGHSRMPVVGPRGLDDVTGIVHLRDLVNAEGTLAEYERTCMTVPDGLKVSDALRQMRTAREQFAVVVDEHGAIDGIITMEDLVEEIVGEIYDETDRDVLEVRRDPDGSMTVPGGFPLHDLPDLGVDAERPDEGDYTTVAGLILAYLGRIPTGSGDVVDIGTHTAEVVEVHNRAITEVRLRPKPARGKPKED